VEWSSGAIVTAVLLRHVAEHSGLRLPEVLLAACSKRSSVRDTHETCTTTIVVISVVLLDDGVQQQVVVAVAAVVLAAVSRQQHTHTLAVAAVAVATCSLLAKLWHMRTHKHACK
jgi:hypothetical protein